MIRARRERYDASFDLTAMIDIVLLLIIFFMLTSHFAQTDLAPVNLPGQKGEGSLDSPDAAGATASIIIDIDQAGETMLFGSPISLEGIVNAAKTGTAGTRIILRADEKCPASKLDTICAALINAGVRTVSLGTAGEIYKPKDNLPNESMPGENTR